MHRHATRLMLTVGAVLAIACAGEAGTGPTGATLSGTYALQTYNGKALPFTISDTVNGQETFSVTYAAPFFVTLNPDNTMRLISTGTFTFGGAVETSTDTTSGNFTVSGNVITVNTLDGDAFTASWNGSDLLTISSPPNVLVFRKQ